MAKSHDPIVHTFKLKKRIARLEREAVSQKIANHLRMAWAETETEVVALIADGLHVDVTKARAVLTLMQNVAAL